MTKHTITWPFSLMLLGLAGEAFAQTSTAEPDTTWPPPSPGAPMYVAWWAPAPDAPTRKWYGDQVLLGYGASDVLVAAGVISFIQQGGGHGGGVVSSFALVGTGLVVQVFAAPIIHWSHGHVGRGFLSLGLSGGLPFAAGALGALASSDDYSVPGAVFGGFLTGMLIGRAIDVAVLSYDKVEEGSPESVKWAAPELTLAPVVGRGQTGLGVAGVF
ncbi:MAG TPA: hypothetical protein VK459_08445 [Polyangiaceae bacterium]|nr:hypothetical protein [Polyangiaceae bacterium]